MNRIHFIVYLLTAFASLITIVIISYLLYSLYQYKINAIEAGLEDQKIIIEYERQKSKKNKFYNLISSLVSIILIGIFIVCLLIKTNNIDSFIFDRQLMVVETGSMSYAHEKNHYLKDNNLSNQFDVFDIIGVEKISDQDIELYDIVVYQKDKSLIIHRIVEINENGQYILRGDANTVNDQKPVNFEQIVGKYTDFKISTIGVFVVFMQSPLGYITLFLVLLFEVGTIFLDKKLDEIIKKRLKTIGYLN